MAGSIMNNTIMRSMMMRKFLALFGATLAVLLLVGTTNAQMAEDRPSPINIVEVAAEAGSFKKGPSHG